MSVPGSVRRWIVSAAALLALAGCGDAEHRERWRAERASWHAQREVDRILVRPQVAKPSDFARAEAGFRAIVAEFPAARWGAPGARGMTAEIGRISARSAVALARLAELQNRTAEALAGYRSAESAWTAYPDVALEAAMLAAATRTRIDDPGAPAAWEHLARTYAADDPTTGEPRGAWLEAARQLADGFEAAGRTASRDSVLRAEEQTAERWLGAHAGHPASPLWMDAIAEARSRRGDAAGALAVERGALAQDFRLAAPERLRRILDLGERSLAAGRADSAMTYARWADREFEGIDRLRPLDLEARAFRVAGERDSALGVYDRILTEFPRREGEAAEARYQRAVLLEELDRWPLARSEYSALFAASPTHPRALQSWQRVILHERAAHQEELARIETEHALGALDQLIAMQHDEGERARTREARIGVLLAAGRTREGIRDLQDLWAAAGVTMTSGPLGETAAHEAETGLHDPALARSLWQILARSSPDRELRGRASAVLARTPGSTVHPGTP